MTAQGTEQSFAGIRYSMMKVEYRGQATTFSVDYRTDTVSVVAPASGPTLSLGTSVSNNAKTVTVAAGGANKGGFIIVCCGKGV